MKMRKIILITLLCALVVFGCDDKGDTHTHEWGAWQYNATQHWRECSCGEKADAAAHTAGDWKVDQAATATTEGSQHKECTVCGYVIETETIPATGEPHTHEYSATWSSNATQHWRECSCGDKTDVADHDWEWLETTQPTITTEGEETRTCTTCGATEKQAVAKLPSCTCDPKEHYLPCDCGATDCTCVVIPRGYVTATAEWGDTNFPIYQSVGVENEQAITATQTIINAYDGLGGTYKITLAGANVEIWIVPSTELNSEGKDETTGKVTMYVRWNITESQFRTRIQNYIIPLLTP